MFDECRINRPTTTTFNRGTELEVETPGVQIYPDPTKPDETGRCRIQVLGGQTFRDSTAGEQQVTTRLVVVAVPWHVSTVEPDCVVTIIQSQADPRLNNRQVTVTGVEISTFATARRIHAVDNLA